MERVVKKANRKSVEGQREYISLTTDREKRERGGKQRRFKSSWLLENCCYNNNLPSALMMFHNIQEI